LQQGAHLTVGVANYGALGHMSHLDFQLFNFSGHTLNIQLHVVAYPVQKYRLIAIDMFIARIS